MIKNWTMQEKKKILRNTPKGRKNKIKKKTQCKMEVQIRPNVTIL